ncbi:SDR family NAD(P)-dependent oxidoreductase [Candidatus Latescibacterota bacterium]
MDLGIKNKIALVTGGSHGIGLATAQALADEGCNVAICARNADRVNEAVLDLKSRNVDAVGVVADVLNPSDINNVMETVIGKWNTIHILVNNVGGGGHWGSPSIEETSDEVWLDVFSKNTMAAVRFTRQAIPYMRNQKWGRVVTNASISGREAGSRPWYSVAKSSEIMLMKSFAVNSDLVRHGITFNSIAPGIIMIPDTEWDIKRKENPDEFTKMSERNFPLGRPGSPEEVASTIVFVCSEKASLINGACIVVDGGESKSV